MLATELEVQWLHPASNIQHPASTIDNDASTFPRGIGISSAPRRHYHGWQRAMGEAASFAACRRASRRRGIGARHHSRFGRTRNQISDALRVFSGELEPAQG